MIKCEKCGMEYEKKYIFCPKCGAKMYKNSKGDFRKKQKNIRKAIIFSGLAVVLVLAVFYYIENQPSEELVINQGHAIEMNVGDSVKLTASGAGIETLNSEDITWTSNNDKVIKINNGVVEAYYDEDSFFSDAANDSSSYSVWVEGTYKDGKTKWAGKIQIFVSLIPVEFESGKLFGGPVSSEDGCIIALPSNKFSSLLYLENKTNKGNDMAYLIKKGEHKTVYIPADDYKLYIAQGTTWYGNELLFGPSGRYLVDHKEYYFSCGYTIDLCISSDELDPGDGSYDDLDFSDFPKL